MIPPKYKFYIGKLDRFLTINSGVTIDNNGEYIYNPTGAAKKFSTDLKEIESDLLLMFDFKSMQQYNAVFFYDENMSFISMACLLGTTGAIMLPEGTKYWAARFTTDDSGFPGQMAKFVYYFKRIVPHYRELNKKYSKESGQEFFRASLDGKISVFGEDYEWVKESALDEQFMLFVEKQNAKTAAWAEYYRGEFNKTDCKFDFSKKSCELKSSAIDAYNKVLNNYENKYDLIKLAPELTKITLNKRSLIQLYISGANMVSNFSGGTYWETEVTEPVDDYFELQNKYHFAYRASGVEFYVSGAPIAAINGVYAGTNGIWTNGKGYTCYVDTPEAEFTSYFSIKRDSDGVRLYGSNVGLLRYENTEWGITFPVGAIMTNVNDPTDSFTLDNEFGYGVYGRVLCDVDSVLGSTTYDIPLDDFIVDNKNFKKCIGLEGGNIFCTSETEDEPTKYGQNDYGKYFTNKFLPSVYGLYRPLPICRSTWANASLWYAYDITYKQFEEKFRKPFVLKDSYSVAAVIKALLKKINPEIQHEATEEYSKFLYSETMPVGDGQKFYVYMTQKTNILKGDYDQAAQKAEASLEDVMKMLRDCFRCYWFIEDNKLKIEHISYFNNGGSYTESPSVQLDLTTLRDAHNKVPISYFQTEVEYDKSELSSRYEFNWMDDVTDLFGNVSIDVNSNYVQKDKKEEITVNQFSPDIDFMLFNPTNFSNDGFALLCPTKNYEFIEKIDGAYVSKSDLVLNNYLWDIYLYKVEVGSTYRVQGQNAGYITGAALFSDRALTNLVSTYAKNPNSSSSTTFYIDVYIEVPEGAEYLALTARNSAYLDYVPENMQKITEYDLVLPIIEMPLIDEDRGEYNAVVQNWYASWGNLIRYYMDDMPATTIDCNIRTDLTVRDVKMSMKHSVAFQSEEDADTQRLITTSVGDGKVDEVSINMNTRQAKAKLVYRPE